MKRKLMIIVAAIMLVGGYAVYTAAENSILIQNVLADSSTGNAGSGESDEGDTVLDFMREKFGCGGGEHNCFEGSVSFAGASISGKWFVNELSK